MSKAGPAARFFCGTRSSSSARSRSCFPLETLPLQPIACNHPACYIITDPKQLGAAMRSLTIANDNVGRVLVFPLARQTATIRKTAEAVNDQHGAEADRYWQRMIAEKRAEMVAAGISEEAVESELRAFSESVFSSLKSRCGGAAK